MINKLIEGPEEYWVSRQDTKTKIQGPWLCDGKDPIPYDDPTIRTRKNVNLLAITYGNRNGNQTIEYADNKSGDSRITILSTGIPFAHRESDVDTGVHAMPPAVSNTGNVEPKEPKAKQIEEPKTIRKVDPWDSFLGLGGGDGLGSSTMDYMMNQDR